MPNKLAGKRIAILVADGFEQVEMTEPRKALEDAGAQTDLISPAKGQVQAWKHQDKGDRFPVDIALEAVDAENYDALLLPGGVANPDKLRTMPKAVQFARSFFDDRKPVAAICHGPWLLVEANVVQGRRVTSWPSLQTDLRNAGAEWTDRQVVEDDGLITSRKPDDIPAFNEAIIALFGRTPAREAQAVGASRRKHS